MIKRIVMLNFLALICVSVVYAGNVNELGLDETTSYDIYLGGSYGNAPVLKGVKIIETRTINNLVYLVVHPDGFFAKRTDGLIRLDFVQAILPTFTSQPMQNSN